MISETQRANLAKLADYLAALPKNYEGFRMSTYSTETHKAIHECGTAACAAGHGPAAGIEAEEDEDWQSYVSRVFFPFLTDRAGWLWCFSPAWQSHDNTPHGAAARIRWYLEHGLPEDFLEQVDGTVPLCYEVAA